jgi:DNA polymerase sigma
LYRSFITGLGDWTSDIDIYVDLYGESKGLQTPKMSSRELLEKCSDVIKQAKCVYSHKRVTRNPVSIRDTRVPIIKFKYIYFDVNCDLSFENLISVRNSEMISTYLQLHPVVRPLMIFIRYWGKFHELTGSSSIKNYALSLLVLVFLAKRKIVPPIVELQKLDGARNAGNPHIIDGKNDSHSFFRILHK